MSDKVLSWLIGLASVALGFAAVLALHGNGGLVAGMGIMFGGTALATRVGQRHSPPKPSSIRAMPPVLGDEPVQERPRAPVEPTDETEGKTLLLEALRKNRGSQLRLFTAAVLGALTIPILWDPNDRLLEAGVLLLAGCAVFGLVRLVALVRDGGGERNVGFRAWRDTPGQIAWVYAITYRAAIDGRELGPTSSVWVCLRSGRRVGFSVADPEVDRLIAIIAARATDAALGYSEALHHAFKRAPAEMTPTEVVICDGEGGRRWARQVTGDLARKARPASGGAASN